MDGPVCHLRASILLSFALVNSDYRVLESIPDLTPLLKPTALGDFATYFFASAGGLFLGGELGMNLSFSGH